MVRQYKPHIPRTIGEIVNQMSLILLKSPTFEDPVFPGRNVESVFHELNDGLDAVRRKLGEDRYRKLRALSDRVRAHFEADPEDTNGETRAGRKLVLEMEKLLEGAMKG